MLTLHGASLSPPAPVLRHGNGASHTTLEDFAELLGAIETRLRDALVAAPTLLALNDCALVLGSLRALLAQEEHQQHQQRELAATLQARLVSAAAELAQAREAAQHDSLTLLPNRSVFGQRVARAVRQAEPNASGLAVLFVDLDGMKAVNDTHGHAVGDQLLTVAAQRLLRAVRSEDVVCRHGGDEFALLLAGIASREDAAQVAAKLSDTLAAPWRIGALDIQAGGSIGIALGPGDGRSGDELLHKADLAMYHAKRTRCRYAFFDELPAAACRSASG